jgi:beta-lactamase class A
LHLMQPPNGRRFREATEQVAAVFADVNAHGYVHACPVAEDAAETAGIGLDADAPVSAASVIKILFAVAFARAVEAGTLDPAERIEVPDSLRVGGTGTAGFIYPPLVSLRDLATSMMTVSDNAATDLIFERVGRAAVEAVITDLHLAGTRVVHDMAAGHRQAAAELGVSDERDLSAYLAAADPAVVRALGWLDPARANAMTARDATTLLCAVWTDRAGTPAACAMVREVMEQQNNKQRIASGFADEIRVAGKTGTLPGIRNEAGVVTYPDGLSYAISVFTRTESLGERNAPLDAAMGRAAAIAVTALRADG